MIVSCTEKKSPPVIRLMTLDPGHFHAALVQKVHYDGVDTNVHVFAPEGQDLIQHLERVDRYNHRESEPTHWAEHIYIGPDYLDKMVSQKPGNLVVIAGNNRLKSQYISRSLQAGLNVLADKPMIILPGEFAELEAAFRTAREKGVLLYDIMTERFEINSMLQRELAQDEDVFGDLEAGSPQDPAVIKESIHYFRKVVSGKPLIRPSWFFDPAQQGEGIVDVTTHLVDLVQWTCFPDRILNHRSDVVVLNAERSATPLTLSQFGAVTGMNSFPGFLSPAPGDSVVQVFSNGAFTYTLKGVHARVSVRWDYLAGEGRGDSHYSLMRGSRSSLVIRQGEEQGFRPVLYIEPKVGDEAFGKSVERALQRMQAAFPGIQAVSEGDRFRIDVPKGLQTDHEAHFAQVMERYLSFIRNGGMPEWEVPNMLTKYYTTTEALRIAGQP